MAVCPHYIIQVHGIPEYINTFLLEYLHQVFYQDLLHFLYGTLA